MTLAASASLRQVDDESLRKFMDRFEHTAVQIRNLNLELALYSMLLALCPDKFADSHNIEDYWDLKYEIEELIQVEYLAQFF